MSRYIGKNVFKELKGPAESPTLGYRKPNSIVGWFFLHKMLYHICRKNFFEVSAQQTMYLGLGKCLKEGQNVPKVKMFPESNVL